MLFPQMMTMYNRMNNKKINIVVVLLFNFLLDKRIHNENKKRKNTKENQ